MMLRCANLGRFLAVNVRVSIMAMAASVACEGTAALAQTAADEFRSVDHYLVTVVSDATPMKCIAGRPYYAVETMKRGQVLRVDGERAGWLRVEYLAGMRAFVRPDEAGETLSGRTLRLTKPSRLWAVNTMGTEKGYSWNLLERELPTDTVLEIRETLKAADGSIRGYLVVPPAQARGYVKADSVRKATAEEAAATGKLPPGRTIANVSGGNTPTTTTSAGTPENAIGAIPDVESLVALFDSAMSQAGDEAELTSVMAQFTRKIDSLGDTTDDQHVRTTLEQRLQALTLRRDILATLQKVRAETAAAGNAGR